MKDESNSRAGPDIFFVLIICNCGYFLFLNGPLLECVAGRFANVQDGRSVWQGDNGGRVYEIAGVCRENCE